MKSNSNNQMSSQAILQDGISKMAMCLAGTLLFFNFTQLFPYILLMVSSLLAGYFISKIRDEHKEKVVVNEKINFFESMIHDSNDAILLYHMECEKYQYVNKSFENEFRMSLKKLNAAKHPEFSNITNANFDDMLSTLEKGEQSNFKFEVKMTKKDGSEGSFDATLERIIIDGKNFAELKLHEITEVSTKVAAMSKDIHNYEEIIQQYKDSNRELEEQAAMVASHDLQKPIQQIQNDIKELESESWFKLDEGEKSAVHSIRDQAINLADMVHKVMGFSAVGSNITVLEMEPMSEIVQAAINQLETKIKETNTIIEFAQMPEMMVDSRQMKHLFKDLIENAIDNRGCEAAEIMIGCTKEEDQYIISISDNCRVIEDGGEKEAFENFWRLNNQEGGLDSVVDLTICNKIITNHHGTIGVESEGEGATIYVSIPMTTSNELISA